jgi:ERCC4-type nuclease
VATQALTILADHREQPSGIVDALAALGVDVRTTTLPVADYIVARGVGVERKTVADLHRSIIDGRLWLQVASLRVDLDATYLVVEGQDVDRGPITPNGIRGAILEVIALGIPVLRSTDVRDTASWLTCLARRTRDSHAPRRPERSRRRGRVTPASVLSEVPGISPRLVSTLLDRFGSVAGIAVASSSDLMTVPGIGAERAKALHRLLGNR